MAGHVGPGVTVGEQEGQGPQKVFATKTHLGSSLGAQGEEPRAHAGDAPPGATPGPPRKAQLGKVTDFFLR